MHDWALADAWDLTTLHYARHRFLPRAVRQADSMPNGRIGWGSELWIGGRGRVGMLMDPETGVGSM